MTTFNMTETDNSEIDKPEPLTLEVMRADIARMIEADLDEVGDHDNLMDLGLDSMRMMSLVVKWGQTGIRLEFSELAEFLTLSEWWNVIQKLQQQSSE